MEEEQGGNGASATQTGLVELRSEPSGLGQSATIPCEIKSCRRGHPLTQDNIQKVGAAGTRCKACRRRITREHARRVSGYYTRSQRPRCDYCGADMVQTHMDSWECGDACPVSNGVMGEWEWDASAKAEWAAYLFQERYAQAIEARSDAAGTGAAEGESAVRQDAPQC